MEVPKTIGMEIGSISNLIRRSRQHNGEDELTRMQMWIIGYMRHRNEVGDVFQRELERNFNMTRATASSILKRMERDSLIIREPVSHDGRLKKITLTEEAVRRSDEVERRIRETEKMMAEGISQEDMAVFFRVADRVKENLSKDCG